MRAEDKSFFFLATPAYYDIPFFQRAYVWNKDNWSELLANLIDTNQSHFLGSIILKSEDTMAGHLPRFSVIDGQQRLTTLSVLLRACYDHIFDGAEEYGFDSEGLYTCQAIMRSLLFVSEGDIFKPTLHVKINHSYLDKTAYNSVIIGDLAKDKSWQKYVDLSEDDNTSSIIKAYAFFRNALLDLSQDCIFYLWKLLTEDRIKFLVNINLKADDNEQAIFDTVNSAGVRLSSADTIKNLLYQKYVELLKKSGSNDVDKVAVSFYESTWVHAFLDDDRVNAYWERQRQYGRMRRSNIETFLHAFAVVKGFFNPAENNMSNLPGEYKKHVSEMDLKTLNSFMIELHDYSSVFMDYLTDDSTMLSYDDYIGRVMNICNVLEVSTFYPFLLKQIYSWRNNQITEEVLKKTFFDLEKYIILNAICKGSTKNYNNECIQLVEGRKTPREIMDSSFYITEPSFTEGLRRMTTNKLPTLLLFWIELYERSKNSLIAIKNLNYIYTLEHIMPQKWKQNWYDIPVYDYEGNVVEEPEEIDRVRDRAIYQIGNMTLLSSKLNSSVSNSTFSEKINGKNGRKGLKALSDLHITRDVVNDNSEWNELKIYDRTTVFENQIREIWKVNDLPVDTPNKSSVDDNDLKEKRYKFWEMALPIIRKYNDNKMYTNTGAKFSNELHGYFGIGGFRMICVANYDCARVDLFLCKGEKQKNKEAFDMLYSHKAEIESMVGDELCWERADEYKSSWINYKLDGIGVENESDWEKLSNFLAEWSNKFRIAMVPYLQERFSPDSSYELNPEKEKRLEDISQIINNWMSDKRDVICCPEKSTKRTIRFKTAYMSKILPDTPGALSDWNTPNHYFYEIINSTATEVIIQLSFSSRNATDELRNTFDRINEFNNMKQSRPEWIWWKVFKTDKIIIAEEIDKNTLYKELDNSLIQINRFESFLDEHLN